jgi:hypothetical protein
LALEQNGPQEAIELLETNGPCELAVPSVDFYSFFEGLYRVYVRDTVLELRQAAKAAPEFQKILTDRGLVAGDRVGTTARLCLARAYAMEGETGKQKRVPGFP